MQFLLSIISLLAIVTFAVWWSMREVEVLLPPTDTTQNVPASEALPNRITTSIEQAEEAKRLIESRNLIALDLSEQSLTKVPAYVFDRVDVESLDLSNNFLTGSLQAEIRRLENLKTLDLSGNKFTGVPAEIGQLKNLETLNLSNNLLTGLPYELGNLSNLKTLKLSGNSYSAPDLEVIKKNLPKTVIIETE